MSPDAPPPAIDVAIVNWNTAEAALAAARAYLRLRGRRGEGDDRRQRLAARAAASCCARAAPRGCGSTWARRTSATARAANRALRGGRRRAGLRQQRRRAARAGGAGGAGRGGARRAASRAWSGPVFGGDTDRYHAALPGTATMLARIFAGSFGERPQPSPRAGRGGRGRPALGRLLRRPPRDLGSAGRLRRGLLPLVRGRRPGQAPARRRLPQPRRRLGQGRPRRRRGLRPDRLAAQQQAIRLRSVERYIRLHHRRAMPIAAPLLRLSRRLRAGGAR